MGKMSQKPLFTEDEMNLLSQCYLDSLVRRAIPLGIIFAGSMYAGIQYEYIPRDPNFGASPLVLFSGLLGFAIGKHTYQYVCMDKYNQLPDSKHGALYHTMKNMATGETAIIVGSEGVYSVIKS